MYRIGSTVLALLVLASAVPPALAADGKPAPSNVPGREFPKIHDNLRVTFRLKAPDARKVRLAPRGDDNGLGHGPFEMEQDAAGMWSVTTPPVRPGFHYYELVIDGFRVNDPASETFFGWGQQTSGLEVPDAKLDFYACKDVPHGEVRALWYHSKVTAQPRRAFVYTPPDYDRQPQRRYAVLYLQHGAGESERAWSLQGRVNFILDNLIAAGKAEPMLVVMDNGYATPADVPRPGRDSAFGQVVVKDLVPLVDTRYRTLADRDHRAIAGLSMGAMQALRVGLKHPDLFASIGCFSGVERDFNPQTSFDGALADAAQVNARWRLLWLGWGRQENPAGRADFHEKLQRAGIRHVSFQCDGTHEWQVWRKHLHDLAQRLFRHAADSPPGSSAAPGGGAAAADDWFAPCRSVAEYRPKGPAHCYRQFNIDWSWIGRGARQVPELLSEADPVEFAEFCRKDGLDGTIVMAVPHHGYCTYETRVGTRFPGMKGDWFGRTIEELHKRKIAAFGYITINWNWKFMRGNFGRDFVRAQADSDGRLDGLICLNAPGFLERIEAYTREVLLGYPVDGLRYDILSTVPGCTCDGCRKSYRELYGEELATWDHVPPRRREDFYQATVARVVSRLTRVGKQIKPSVPMWQNSIQSYAKNDLNLGRTQDIAYNEYGDPFRVLFLKGVTGKRAVINGMMNDLALSPAAKIDRPNNRLCLALGGRSYSYFGHKLTNYRTALPGKEMAAWHRDELAPFYRMIAEIETYLEDARPVAPAAVVFCEATRYRWPDYGREPYVKAMQAVSEACLARSLPLEFVNCLDLAQPGGDLSRFKTLLLPLTSGLSPEQLESLRRYVRDGGNLLVVGDALRHDAQGREQNDFALAAEMGIRFRAVLQAGREPWMVSGQLAGRPLAAEVKTLVEIESVAGQTLFEARRFDRALALLHVRSLGRGKVAFLASLDSPPLLEQTIEFLAGEAPVSVHPSQKRAVLTQQPQKRRWILHLLDEGSYDVDVSHAWAAASRVVAQYPATGWGYSLETTSAGLRIGVRGDADDRLLVLE